MMIELQCQSKGKGKILPLEKWANIDQIIYMYFKEIENNTLCYMILQSNILFKTTDQK